MAAERIEICEPCPVCGENPDIDRVEPWDRKDGPAPFYAAHYSLSPIEHTLGCNADTEKEVRKEWNRIAREHRAAPQGARHG